MALSVLKHAKCKPSVGLCFDAKVQVSPSNALAWRYTL